MGYSEEELIALEKYEDGQKHSSSTFIDEDTIIAGYGKLDYDFEFPLPVDKINEIYGTTSWIQWFINNGYKKYLTINKETEEESVSPWLSEKQVKNMIDINPNFIFKDMKIREEALAWWDNLTIVEKAFNLSKMKDNNTLDGRKVESLTGREIEEIHKFIS